MKNESQTPVEAQDGRDFTLPGGCMLCGGDLDVRVIAEGAGSVCRSCRWISRPQLRRVEGSLHVAHPVAGNG